MKSQTKLSFNKRIPKFSKYLFLLASVILFCSHDLYIKMGNYFLQPNHEATLSLYNGTFEKSENIITRDRIIDASIVAQGIRTTVEDENWKDKDSTITQLNFKAGESGTYVVGVSTKARNIELTAEKFNSYLKNDGVWDMLEKRTKDSLLNQSAIESYQKHVKAIYQVGEEKSTDWNTVLGYPIEFVPQANPYEKFSGETLDVQLLLDGKPLANQLVFADHIKSGHSHKHEHDSENHSHEDANHSHDSEDSEVHSHEHSHDSHDSESHSHEHSGNNTNDRHNHDSEDSEAHSHEHSHDSQDSESHSHEHSNANTSDNHTHDDEDHNHTSGQQLRSNDQGIVTVDLPEDGIYYLRSIYMTRATESQDLTHRSKWATLTFEVSHSHDTESHTHDHDHEESLPIWVFVLGSLLMIGVLFLIFRKKDK